MENKLPIFRHILMAILVANASNFAKAQAKNNNVYLSKCQDYTDKRELSMNSDQNTISIPFSRTSQQAYEKIEESASFNITIKGETLRSNLECALNNSEIRNVTWNITDNEMWTTERRNFYDATTGSAERHQHAYFTESGHFYDASTGNYYNSKDGYCVETISDDYISLRICLVKSDCSNPNTPNTYCLPKCCALDETLLFWKRQCTRLPETIGMTPWQSLLYQDEKNPHKIVNLQTNLIYHMTELPKNCSLIISEDGNIEEKGYGLMSAVHVKHPKYDDRSEERQHFKLSLPSGVKGGMLNIMVFDYITRKWLVEKIDHFCVEGFHVKSNETPTYIGTPDNYVLIYCMNDADEQSMNEDEQKSLMYVVVSMISLVFLLSTLVVYGVLWNKHNLHGLTIASYIASMFGAYLLFTIAHMIYLYPNPEISGLHDRGPFCYTVATSAHYFYLSTYFWLTVMNLDLWMTLSSMRTVRRDSKEWEKFGIYSVIGWGVPIVFIIACVVIDHVYRDPLTEVPVPDYAVGACFVSSAFRGEYVFTPMAILLAINIFLIAMTMGIFLKARCRNSDGTTTGNVANRYNCRLFAKLFIVMGGTSLIDFLTWVYNNNDNKPWIIVVLEAISYLVPVMYFFLFCLNEKVIGQLREKCPRFMDKLQPVIEVFLKDKSRKRYTFDNTTASTNKTRDSTLNGINKNQDIQLQSLVQE